MDLIKWLLEGDVSIQYQTYRDLLEEEKPDLRQRISTEGFGKSLLQLQSPDGNWGGGFYHYKWINTHYTLLELRRLEVKSNSAIMNILDVILKTKKTADGGITPNPRDWEFSDVCINGMGLFYLCYFGVKEEKLKSIVDFIILQQMSDGGFNCNYNYPKYGAKHSSLHSTISLIEGINSYTNSGYQYRLKELLKIRSEAIEFILCHRMFKSDKTGEIINRSFTMLSYPPRWKYDILRAFEAFREAGIKYDVRMDDAFEIIINKQRKDNTWPLQAKHPGRVHFDMEQTGKSSRWNTLRVLRTIKHFNFALYKQLIF